MSQAAPQPPDGARSGESSLGLSPEQFLILADVLGEPVPAYIAAPVAEHTGPRRRAALADAWRSLVARGVVIEGEPVQVPVTAVRLVQIVCRPVLSMVVHRGVGVAWSSAVTRIAAVPEAAVELRPDKGGLRLTPVHTGLLLERVGRGCGIAPIAAPRAPAARLPLALLRVAAAADRDAAARILADSGVPAATAESVGAALTSGERCAVSATIRAGTGRRVGGEVAWVVGVDGYWLLPPALTPLGGADAGATGDAGHDPVELRPISGDDLLDALAGTASSIES